MLHTLYLGTQRPQWGLPHHRSRGHTKPLWYHNVMTQLRPSKILSTLGLNKARTILFLGHPYTPKPILPIKAWITSFKPTISLVLCWCGICLGYYTQPMVQAHTCCAQAVPKERPLTLFSTCLACFFKPINPFTYNNNNDNNRNNNNNNNNNKNNNNNNNFY